MGGRKLLALRLAASATPARVARAAVMLAEIVETAFPRHAEGMTVIVENLTTTVWMKGWEPGATTAIQSLDRFIDNPTDRHLPFDGSAIAEVLAEYCREVLADEPTFWRGGARKPFRVVDREFIKHLSVVVDERPSDNRPRLRGTTVIASPVLRCGRTKEGSPARARIVLPGIGEREVKIGEGAYGSLCDAVKSRAVGRIRLKVQWRRGVDGDLEICADEVVALGFEPRVAPVSGARMVQLLAENPPITSAELDGVLKSLREENGD